MKRGGLYPIVVVILGVLFFGSTPSFAQKTTGDITGTVTDAGGGSVPGADVTAHCEDTGFTRKATTGSEGLYRITDLPVCVYAVSVSKQGFKTTERQVQVAAGVVTTADVVLQVGQLSEKVIVEEAAPLIEFTDKVNNNVDQQRILNLPLNGRDFNSLLGITPGVQRQPGGGFLAVNITGTRRTSNNYQIDGINNNDRYYGDSLVGQTGVIGVPATTLGNDAIQEFTVQQLPSAEYGVKGGATINVVLRSGTNDFHGSGFYFGHWNQTDARNFFAAPDPITGEKQRTPITNRQYGGTFGGPIVKDRTFFFGIFEGQRNQTVGPYQILVPTPDDLVAGRSLAESILDVSPGTPLPGDQLLSYFPTDPSGTLTAQIPNVANFSSFIIKMDHRLNDRHQLTGRYYFGDSFQSAPSFGYTLPAPASSGLGPDAFNSIAPSRPQLVGATWTFAISPNKILETRFGYSRFSQILEPNNKIDPRTLGLDTGPLDPADFGVPYVYASYLSYGYIGGVAGYPISTRPDANYDFAEHFTWTKGKHTIKMGGNFEYSYTDSLRNRARTAFQVTSGPDPVTQIAQILLLRFDRASRSFGSTARHMYQPSMGLYVQDDWKLTRRWTLSFGMRYDLSGALGESDRQGANFFPDRGFVSLGAGGIKRLYDLDTNNFGPRAGFAWDVFGNGKTALRAGYALTYDIPNFGSIAAPRTASINGSRAGAFTNVSQGDFSKRVDSAGNPLTDANVDSCLDTDPSGEFICGGTGHLIYGANPTGDPPFNAMGIAPNLKVPMYHYYNLTWQQQVATNSVLTVSYVGSQGRDLLMYRDLNARPLGCWDSVNRVQLTTGNCARPFDSRFRVPCASDPVNGCPEFLTIIQLTNDSKSWYNSLQVSLAQRNWHGITTQYNFTWSKCIDYNSINRGSSTNISPAQNPYHPSANRGVCDYDIPKNFNVGGLYDIPKFAGLGRFGSGWQIGTVVTLLDGRPFTATVGSRDRSGQDLRGNLRADCLAAPIYNTRDPSNYIGNPRDPDTGLSLDFVRPPDNTIGTCGRNSLRGPGFAQWDISLTKMTQITERMKFQFRWEIFNALNRANFASPTTNVRSGGFGTTNATTDTFAGNPVLAQGAPRNMQFVFKFIF